MNKYGIILNLYGQHRITFTIDCQLIVKFVRTISSNNPIYFNSRIVNLDFHVPISLKIQEGLE